MKSTSLLLAVAFLAFALPRAFGQGSLTPPGPPGPTMKTLNEIEPRIPLNQSTAPGDATCVFKITQPGSYMLTGNFKPPAGKHGILVALLLPGNVTVDMMGFTIDGVDAGASASGILIDSANTQEDDVTSFTNGTIRNFAGTSCLQAATTGGVLKMLQVHVCHFFMGVNTPGKLVMEGCSLTSEVGQPIQMGSDSELSHVLIKAGIPKIIGTTGSRHRLSNVNASAVWSGGSWSGSGISLGANSVVNGMHVRISDVTYTGPVLGNSSGFTEVSGLGVELTNVTAPCAFNSMVMSPADGCTAAWFLTSSQGPYQITSSQGPYQLTATNCTFTSYVGLIPASFSTSSDNYCPRIMLNGTTTTPTVLRVDDANCTITADIKLSAASNITGGVIRVYGAANTISSTIRGLVGGSAPGIEILNEQASAVVGCHLIGRNDSAVTGIRIAASVTNVLVANNRASGFASGSVLVNNLGGPTNAIAPIVNAGNIATNTNPMANVMH